MLARMFSSGIISRKDEKVRRLLSLKQIAKWPCTLELSGSKYAGRLPDRNTLMLPGCPLFLQYAASGLPKKSCLVSNSVRNAESVDVRCRGGCS